VSLLLLFHPGVGSGPITPPTPTPTTQPELIEAGGYQQGAWRTRAQLNRTLGDQDAEDLFALARAAIEHLLRGGR